MMKIMMMFMKVFILRGVMVNRLPDNELEKLMNAGVEFAITNNNGSFGIDNTEGYCFNTNSLVFMWPEYYVEEKESYIDKINNCANVVADVIKDLFTYCPEDKVESYLKEWEHVKNVLNQMRAFETLKYDLSEMRFKS